MSAKVVEGGEKLTVLEVANNWCVNLVFLAILLCYYCYLD